jgi:hypothetical protein
VIKLCFTIGCILPHAVLSAEAGLDFEVEVFWVLRCYWLTEKSINSSSDDWLKDT